MLSDRVVLNLDEQLINSEDTEKQRLYDAWFAAEVEKGIKSAREEPLVDHEDVVRQIRSTITKAQEENAAEVVQIR